MKRSAAVVVVAVAAVGGCAPKQVAPIAQIPVTHVAVAKGRHETAHGGVLNAIVKCEIGHAEVKREGDTLNVWFVGGAPDTTKAVRIPDKAVTLAITLPGRNRPVALSLKPAPLDLAGETVGNCSRFTARAEWLKDATNFTAIGRVTFKGQKCPIRVEYPNGYDPD